MSLRERLKNQRGKEKKQPMGGFSRFAGKAAVVTDAGQGIGEGVALRFSREGAKLAVADIAAAAAFPCSDEAHFITGQTIFVRGGAA
ncbi:MAG: hypothetical protein AB1742_03370 [bacterium]